MSQQCYKFIRQIPKHMTFTNAVSWFEIPSTDINRSQKFYEAIFDITMVPMDLPHLQMRMFPIASPTNVGGAICQSENFYKPSVDSGPLVYLNANPDVDIILERVEAAGGTVLVPKMEVSPEHGYIGVFIDPEGNRVGLHSILPGLVL
jgi:predicted enzyme related to lactoylglutathione lyase